MRAASDALVAAWYGGARWPWLLRPLEAVFRAVTALRRRLYRWGLLTTYRAPVPVVIVGNITVGGTGKTPVVIALVEALQARGVKVGVVSRGYGADRISGCHRVGPGSTARDCGDEPLLIHQRTGCPCVVAPLRARAVRNLLASTAVDLIISDDGLQHYALERDLEIAVVDHERRWGNGFCLPAGPLREPLSRLRSVDRVVFRGSADPLQGVQYLPLALVNLATGATRRPCPDDFAVVVHAVAGIGQPEQFFAQLEQLGFKLQPHVFGDHHDFTAADLSALGDKPVIMTEKDAVKCRDIAGDGAWYLKIDARLPATLIDEVAALVDP